MGLHSDKFIWQSRVGHQDRDQIFFFPCFKDDPRICPVVTLKAYKERTVEFRGLQLSEPKTRLFLSWIGEHNLVTSSIARWLLQKMLEQILASSSLTLYEELPVPKQLEQVLQLNRYQRLQIGPQRAPSKNLSEGMTKLSLAQVFCHPKVLQTIATC